jgi:5-enolpyruvylshikimate-3-phosphate synthase
MAAMGARIERWNDDDSWHVTGVGLGGFQPPSQTIDFGNSGTGARLVMGLIATTPLSARMSGDASLRSRPMGRIVTPLKLFGTRFDTAEGDRMPLTVHGAIGPCAGAIPAAHGLGAGQVSRASGRSECARRDHRHRTGSHPRPYREDAARDLVLNI